MPQPQRVLPHRLRVLARERRLQSRARPPRQQRRREIGAERRAAVPAPEGALLRRRLRRLLHHRAQRSLLGEVRLRERLRRNEILVAPFRAPRLVHLLAQRLELLCVSRGARGGAQQFLAPAAVRAGQGVSLRGEVIDDALQSLEVVLPRGRLAAPQPFPHALRRVPRLLIGGTPRRRVVRVDLLQRFHRAIHRLQPAFDGVLWRREARAVLPPLRLPRGKQRLAHAVEASLPRVAQERVSVLRERRAEGRPLRERGGVVDQLVAVGARPAFRRARRREEIRRRAVGCRLQPLRGIGERLGFGEQGLLLEHKLLKVDAWHTVSPPYALSSPKILRLRTFMS